jgi:hypothetical protein
LKRGKTKRLTKEYFITAMKKMDSFFQHPIYLVLSDSPEYTKKMLSLNGTSYENNVFFVANGDSFNPSTKKFRNKERKENLKIKDFKVSLLPVGDHIGRVYSAQHCMSITVVVLCRITVFCKVFNMMSNPSSVTIQIICKNIKCCIANSKPLDPTNISHPMSFVILN